MTTKRGINKPQAMDFIAEDFAKYGAINKLSFALKV